MPHVNLKKIDNQKSSSPGIPEDAKNVIRGSSGNENVRIIASCGAPQELLQVHPETIDRKIIGIDIRGI